MCGRGNVMENHLRTQCTVHVKNKKINTKSSLLYYFWNQLGIYNKQTHTHTSPSMYVLSITTYAKTTLHLSPSSSMAAG
jgi:hypothetical protein